jgi:hypothetical protein
MSVITQSICLIVSCVRIAHCIVMFHPDLDARPHAKGRNIVLMILRNDFALQARGTNGKTKLPWRWGAISAREVSPEGEIR